MVVVQGPVRAHPTHSFISESQPLVCSNVASIFRYEELAKQEICRVLLAACFVVISFSACSFTLKMQAACSTKILVDFHWSTWPYIPEDGTPHTHHCENLKFYSV
jgi:hypothetical protein